MPLTLSHLVLLFACFTTFVWASYDLNTPIPSTVVPGAYIVQLNQGSTLSRRDGESARHALFQELDRRGIIWNIRANFGTSDVFSGVSVQLNASSGLPALASLPNVLNIIPVTKQSLPTSTANPITGPTDPKLPPNTMSSQQMTGIDKLQAQGLTGAGLKVAVIDSGVDYMLPVLGGGFGAGFKVSQGYDFVGDNFADGMGAEGDPDPFDTCNTHGTAVASVVAGNYDATYRFIGAAPAANISSYRVFGCDGTSTDDLILQGLMRAYTDGNDIINLSLQDNSGWPESILATVASRIAAKGKVVVASAGNLQPYGAFWGASPGGGSGVIDVGSVDSINFVVQSLNVSDGHAPIPYYAITALPVVGALPIFVPADITGCTPFTANFTNPTEYVYVVERGACAFVTKVQNIQAAGGTYILIYNTEPGLFAPIVPTGSFAVLIGQTDGQYLVAQFAAGKNITLTFPSVQLADVANPETGGMVSDFSAYGPTYDLNLKPSVAGVGGGEIIVAQPASAGSWAIDGGTSFSAPLVSGAAALILQSARKTPGLSILAGFSVLSVLEQTAVAVGTTADDSGPINTLTLQGAGLINAYAAVHTSSFITPSELMLNDTKYPSYIKTIMLFNTYKGAASQTYSITHQPAGTLPSFMSTGTNSSEANPAPVLSTMYATATIVPAAVTIPAGGFALVTVTFKPPVGLDPKTFPVYTGQIVFAANGTSGDRVVATYQGMAAAMYDMPVIDHGNYYTGSYNLPALLDGNGNYQSSTAPPENYTMSNGSFPSIQYRLTAGTPLLRFDLVSALTTFVPTLSRRDLQGHRSGIKRRSHGNGKRLETRSPHLTERDLVSSLLPTLSTPGQSSASFVNVSSIFSWLFNPGSVTQSGTFAQVPIIGALQQQTYVSRNTLDVPENGGLSTFTFSNKTLPSGATVPDGSYRILMRALKITGNPTNEVDYQSWLSPVINIVG
ncbi:hypothetical protein FRB97_003234 [Tulasnella sp. 331]|nr:hypothetical protein FRB97_003234 [Tulasnella sp. 331]KAG8883075.1 hypothetical protein FRB98_003341 [Tulasnella sp. 332]